MARLKRVPLFGAILCLIGNCTTSPTRDSEVFPQAPINPGDKLPLHEIVSVRPDGMRVILATGPEAMRYIFYRAGCRDGSGLAGLLVHEWKPESRTEEWTGACRSYQSDTVAFRISHPGNPLKYREFGEITHTFLKKAEEESNPNWFFLAIENEPALVDARLNLFRTYVEKKQCKRAKRNLELILMLSPGFPQKKSLESFYAAGCGGTNG